MGGGGGFLICTSPMTTGFFGFSPKGPLVQSPAPLSTGPEQIGSQYVNSEPKQFKYHSKHIRSLLKMCHRGLWFRVKVSQWGYGSAILKPCGIAFKFFHKIGFVHTTSFYSHALV